MKALPAKAKALLEQPAFVHLATIMPDGSPQVSPVWVDVDGDQILINSAKDRLKDKNMRRNAHVALSVTDPKNPYHSASIRGHVVAIVTEGADAHIDKLAKKYLNMDSYPNRKPGEVRVIYRIEPDKVAVMG